MSYLVLARKWRPQGFEDLIGQQPIVRVLTNSIEQDKIAHAYIFSGPRGVGKTSTARILAKALNCAEGPTAEPCGGCPSCKAIADSQAVDVHEIDGASNTGVDNIRDLRERVKYAPSGGKFKVYIIDEAHMLSQGAFNALLKTLEEPPPHVVFVLATTEPRKIPLTVMSRCQHLPFRRVSTLDIKQRLLQIAGTEGLNITEAALGMIARAADGSIRDSLTILDQVASFSAEIDDSDVKGLLGISDFKGLMDVSRAIVEGGRADILRIVGEVVDRGSDLRAFTRDLIKFFRDMVVAKLSSRPEEVLDASEEEIESIKGLAGSITLEHLSLTISELIRAEAEVRSSFSPRIALEMALIKISYLSLYRPVSDAIAAISSAGAVPLEELPVVEAPEPEPPAGEPAGQDAASPEPEPVAADAEGMDAERLLKTIIDRIDDPRIASKLAKASAELSVDGLSLAFNANDADICAAPLRDNLSFIEGIASDVRNAPTRVEIKVRTGKATRKKDIKGRAMSEPVVKEALELFEGRVVDVKEVKE